MRERQQFGYIRGNTAVAPERKTRIGKNNNKKKSALRKRNKQKAIIASRKNDRKYMFLIVVTIFIFGCVTISGDNKVYNMQRKVTQLNSDIKTMKEENEDLKVKLLKYSALNNIEENAGAKLGMYVPSSADVVKIDFSENYFSDISDEENITKKIRKSFFFKITDIFK
ncbi:MAG: cell division protein FtsL [Clostridium butyricum]|nr:cell division protein FtsL [Clostridium butyricum]